VYKKRMAAVIKKMKENSIHQLIVSKESSIFYLLGENIDPGERFHVLLIHETGKIRLYINRLFNLKKPLDLFIHWYDDTENIGEIFSNRIQEDTIVGVEKEWPSGFLLELMDFKPSITVRNASKIISEGRMIKDSEEIEALKRASKINDEAMTLLFNKLQQGRSELELAQELSNIYLNLGTDGFSFEPLICYGKACAEPHHHSDHTKLTNNQSVIIDIGCLKDGYCSDMTRSFYFGTPPAEYLTIYALVLKANTEAIKAIKPGVLLKDIDQAGRDIIEAAGYGDYFTHRMGHNIGIEVHEYPDVSRVSTVEAQEGMVFSIEPGIYIPGKYGVRIEDLVLVTKDGCEVLNNYPKNLKTFK